MRDPARISLEKRVHLTTARTYSVAATTGPPCRHSIVYAWQRRQTAICNRQGAAWTFWCKSIHIYRGGDFPGWRDNALVSGLSSQSLVRVALDSDNAGEVARYDMNRRIRAVAQSPDGTLWLLEDGSKGRLLKLEARR